MKITLSLLNAILIYRDLNNEIIFNRNSNTLLYSKLEFEVMPNLKISLILLYLMFGRIDNRSENVDESESPFWTFAYLLLIISILLAVIFMFCLPIFGYCFTVLWSIRNSPPTHQMKPYKDHSKDQYRRLELKTQQ